MKENGFEYVDLGLESGTMWATCNVGKKRIYNRRTFYYLNLNY